MSEEISRSLFSSPPRTFKMDVRSPQASQLKASVSTKLMEFFGNYTDDVLAEYIVVLVCNGKHQNQARDDLEAFLGDKSGMFITWLWNHLSEGSYLQRLLSAPSDLKDGNTPAKSNDADKAYRNQRTPDLHIHSGRSSHNTVDPRSEGPSTLSSNSNSSHVNKSPDVLQRWEPDTSDPLMEVNAKNLMPQKRADHGTFEPTVHCQDEAHRTRYSNRKSSSEISAGDVPHYQFENQSEKTARSNSTEDPQHLPPSLKHLPVPRRREYVTKETAPRNLTPKFMDDVPCQRVRTRGSVWDRLGKPCENNAECQLAGQGISNTNLINNGTGLGRKRMFTEVNCENNSADSLGQKDGDFEDKKTSKRLLKSTSASFSRAENLSEFVLRAAGTVRATAISLHPSSVKSSEPQLNKEVSDFTSSKISVPSRRLGKPDRPSHAVENLNHKPKISEILDVKLKLKQIEMEMLKLRAKQAGTTNDSKQLTAVASSAQGGQNPIEDVESRTIFVTNVHFAATKEALSLHFTKCGAVVNVVLLTDIFNGLPKGSAYIVFASKESAEKALSLSGTSFFSRILKVVWKADMPGGLTEPNQPALKPQPRYPQSYKVGTFQKQHSSPHFHWKREQPSSGETPSTAA